MFSLLKSKSSVNKASEYVTIATEAKNQIAKNINLVGYVMLILTLLDLGFLLIHPQFFNPQWQMNTMGKTIETVWAALLGFILIFYRPQAERIKLQELRKLSILSWVALFLGIFYLITIPFLIVDARKISVNDRNIHAQQIELETAQLKQFEQKLIGASDANLTNFLQPNSLANLKIDSPEKLRDKLIKTIKDKQQEIIHKFDKQLQSKRNKLMKITSKWIIGAIVGGVSFILVWKWTKWIRVSSRRVDRA